MDVKLTLVFIVLMVLDAQNLVQAEFGYNHVFPKKEDLKKFGLKCIPGRTVIRIKEKPTEPDALGNSDYGEYDDGRRSHMRLETNDEYCQMCVCSVEGKDEYCSKRPATNVNECMRMSVLTDQFHGNVPFDHQRTLSYMIRRDYIWHNAEIPYNANAKCRRAHSYYTNNINADETDIDGDSDGRPKNLLGYKDTNVCFYCVCSVDGNEVSCLPKSPIICNYFIRLKADPNRIPRDRYRIMFGQDMPALFRQLSHRMRRTMDDGMYEYIETVAEGPESTTCVPYISTYSDCTDDNLCEGCQKCTCDADSKWSCEDVRQCTEQEKQGIMQANIDSALNALTMDQQMQKNAAMKTTSKYVPEPSNLEYENLLGYVIDEHAQIKIDESPEYSKPEDDLISFLTREKRSVEAKNTNEEKYNGTVTFHHTMDEINEDTLKNINTSGTIAASKIDMIPSRRSTLLTNTTNALQIEYKPPLNSQHVGDNKIDTPAIHDDQVDLLVHHKMYEIVGNQSQATRDKDLSKIVVNELKKGAETIGDKNSPIISNITFTSDNDTLTAMTFIAGNLLNKLWNMEKDESEDSLETEHMKHKKINELLELFKEPLNLRQEVFLKNALQQLSTAIENKGNIGNVSLCKNFEELKVPANIRSELHKEVTEKVSDNDKAATAEALSKITNVLDLIQKYERVQNSLSTINLNSKKYTSKDEKTTLNEFGSILDTFTKLLMPKKRGKKMIKRLKDKNLFTSNNIFEHKLKNFNLTGMTITAKDKMVLDYLAHIQNSPSCLFNKEKEKPTFPNIEGDILLNLSEFFKIKSMSDLLRLVDSRKQKDELPLPTRKTTQVTIKSSENYFTTETNIHRMGKANSTQFEATKQKLKTHLKTILEDLIELQNISGNSTNGKNIEIAEALPCIYNVLNSKAVLNKSVQTKLQQKVEEPNKEAKYPANKATEILENLKQALKHTSETRRTIIKPSVPMPKSAIVWERTIQNLDEKHRRHFRRNIGDEVPKPIEEVKSIIDKFESLGSNTFKSVSYADGVPPTERLIMLKSLNIDNKRYIKALEDIKLCVNTDVFKLPIDQHSDIAEFIDNMDINVNLSRKILQITDKPKKEIKLFYHDVTPLQEIKMNKPLKRFEIAQSTVRTVKISRDQILNQLIKNRMLYYLRMKDGTEGNTRSNINKSLAKKILLYLEIGNDSLARQLYKIFVNENKNKSTSVSSIQVLDPLKYETFNQHRIDRRLGYKTPLIQFEEPKPGKEKLLYNQDELIKQLLNIKNLKS